MYVCIKTNTYTTTGIYIQSPNLYLRACTFMQVLYIYVYIYIILCIYTHIHSYKRTYIHTYIHTANGWRSIHYCQTHTYIHTYIHTCSEWMAVDTLQPDAYKHTHIHTYIHTAHGSGRYLTARRGRHICDSVAIHSRYYVHMYICIYVYV